MQNNTTFPIGKERLQEIHKNACAKALEVMQAKNEDYTAGSQDPFANFRGSEAFGVPAGVGLLTRFQDKLKRAESFFRMGEFKVADEGLADLAVDMINYSVLCYGMLLEIAESQIPQGEPVDIGGMTQIQEAGAVVAPPKGNGKGKHGSRGKGKGKKSQKKNTEVAANVEWE